jgi:hypothetical protein
LDAAAAFAARSGSLIHDGSVAFVCWRNAEGRKTKQKDMRGLQNGHEEPTFQVPTFQVPTFQKFNAEGRRDMGTWGLQNGRHEVPTFQKRCMTKNERKEKESGRREEEIRISEERRRNKNQ